MSTTKSLIESAASGKDPKKVVEASGDMDLLAAIKNAESNLETSVLNFNGIQLPSEDTLIDHPGKYTAKMKKVLQEYEKLLQQLQKVMNLKVY